jgi:hypothetical protein
MAEDQQLPVLYAGGMWSDKHASGMLFEWILLHVKLVAALAVRP